jgi:predicted amidohydrolase
MKICLAQIKPIKGDIARNIEIHKKCIELAIQENADLICFPELSLTSYEPLLAEGLATDEFDPRLNDFQELSDSNQLSILLGLPTRSDTGIHISMVIFQPYRSRQVYSKQLLHADEKPYFMEGSSQVFVEIEGCKIAPAICFESLQPEHLKNAVESGAQVYLASVAKPQRGVIKALDYFPSKAKEYTIPILMTNAVGFCDNFQSVGQSSVWGRDGQLLAQLDHESEGIIFYDTLSKLAEKRKIAIGNR